MCLLSILRDYFYKWKNISFLKLILNSQFFRDVSNFNITWLFLQVKIYLFFLNLISNSQFFRDVSNFNIMWLFLQVKIYLFFFKLNFEQSFFRMCLISISREYFYKWKNIFFLKLILNSQFFRDVSNLNITWLFLQVKIYLFFFNLNFEQSILSGCV